MSPIIMTSNRSDIIPHQFQDKKVDNDGFFQIMEEGLSSIYGIPEIWKQTRLELQKFLAQITNQKYIQGVTEWTADEQKEFFKKVRMEVENTGFMLSAQIREKIEVLIKDEVLREIKDNRKKYSLQDGNGNTMTNINEYKNFLDTSFLLAKETTVIPMDLRLTINKTETIQDAKGKLDKYNGKYNALILVDNENHPIGVIRAQTIQQYENRGHTNLEGISFLSDAFAHYTTTNDQLRKTMQKYGINILPIIDSETDILIGILTNNSLVKKEVQYYSTTSLTNLSLDFLKMNT